MKANTLGIKMKIELKPTSNRFKRLINDFGKDWCFVAHTYFKDKEYVYLYDNDYQLNKRLYPIANVARLDIK